jgi:hypothetical protein
MAVGAGVCVWTVGEVCVCASNGVARHETNAAAVRRVVLCTLILPEAAQHRLIRIGGESKRGATDGVYRCASSSGVTRSTMPLQMMLTPTHSRMNDDSRRKTVVPVSPRYAITRDAKR